MKLISESGKAYKNHLDLVFRISLMEIIYFILKYCNCWEYQIHKRKTWCNFWRTLVILKMKWSIIVFLKMHCWIARTTKITNSIIKTAYKKSTTFTNYIEISDNLTSTRYNTCYVFHGHFDSTCFCFRRTLCEILQSEVWSGPTGHILYTRQLSLCGRYIKHTLKSKFHSKFWILCC